MNASESIDLARKRPFWRRTAAGAMVVIVAVALFLVLRSDDEPTNAGQGATGQAAARSRPVAATPASLAELSKSLGKPVFWVGPSAGRTFELTRTADGSIYVRYLSRGVAVGDPRPDFLTVGTYPSDGAFDTVTRASKRDGARIERLRGGGLAVANSARPNSYFVAFPDSKALVEVYSPKPDRARELVRTNRVVPVA